jgi:hypothetical protein
VPGRTFQADTFISSFSMVQELIKRQPSRPAG